MRTQLTTTGKPVVVDPDTLADSKINNGNPTVCIVGNNKYHLSYAEQSARHIAGQDHSEYAYIPFLKLLPQGMSTECQRDVM